MVAVIVTAEGAFEEPAACTLGSRAGGDFFCDFRVCVKAGPLGSSVYMLALAGLRGFVEFVEADKVGIRSAAPIVKSRAIILGFGFRKVASDIDGFISYFLRLVDPVFGLCGFFTCRSPNSRENPSVC